MHGEHNFVLGKLNGLHQDLLNVVAIAPPARDRGLGAVVLLVVEAKRESIWNVELLYGSCSNQHSVLAAATKDCQSKENGLSFSTSSKHTMEGSPPQIG